MRTYDFAPVTSHSRMIVKILLTGFVFFQREVGQQEKLLASQCLHMQWVSRNTVDCQKYYSAYNENKFNWRLLHEMGTRS